jgi:diaminohydroxyphosphoribosylaminopyrimidine deaminase/5-amino-6-(5-phosphoribosylamino)uracil reductase
VIGAGICRVVSALEDPNPHVAGTGHERLRAAGIIVEVGLREAEARDVHAGHVMRMRHDRPYVTLKMAVSGDEKVGLAGRRPVAISGEEARAKLHLMRSESDAILIGIGTALADNPLLTCRLPGMADRSPVRVVLDYALDLPLSSRLVETAGDVPLWLIAGEDAARNKAERLGSRRVEVLFAQQARPRPDEVLRLLAARGITRVLVEGGPKTAAAFLGADLVDQAILSRSPMIIGPDGIAAFEGLPLSFVAGQQHFTLTQVEQIGQDRFETYRRNG